MVMKKYDKIPPEEEKLHRLLAECSEELQREIVAFFEEGKKKKTIWEKIWGVFKR